MPKPKMIGAHVPRKPQYRRQRCRVSESAEMFNRSYDEWTRRAGRTHLVYNKPVSVT